MDPQWHAPHGTASEPLSDLEPIHSVVRVELVPIVCYFLRIVVKSNDKMLSEPWLIDCAPCCSVSTSSVFSFLLV